SLADSEAVVTASRLAMCSACRTRTLVSGTRQPQSLAFVAPAPVALSRIRDQRIITAPLCGVFTTGGTAAAACTAREPQTLTLAAPAPCMLPCSTWQIVHEAVVAASDLFVAAAGGTSACGRVSAEPQPLALAAPAPALLGICRPRKRPSIRWHSTQQRKHGSSGDILCHDTSPPTVNEWSASNQNYDCQDQ